MNLTITPLSPELAADFFDFFDNRAFTDNSPEGPCYCTRFQMTKEQEKTELFDRVESFGGGPDGFKRALRRVAETQVETGALRGYLAFDGQLSIGWCNANGKANFPSESGNGRRLYAPAEMREKVVLCFEVAPEYRGTGVATALLNRVLTDAKAEGYKAVEGFPIKRGEFYEWDFTGPVRLYEKAGFVKISETDNFITMRKEFS